MSPIAFSIFSFDVRWYGLAYFFSFFIINYLLRLNLSNRYAWGKYSDKDIDSVLSLTFLSMIIGGRLFYVLIYEFEKIFDFIYLISIWNGGMAALGGFIGGFISLYFASKSYKIELQEILNSISLYLPIALFFGRIANLINGEIIGNLWGYPIIYYNIFFEGIFLFVLLHCRFLFFKNLSPTHLFMISYGSIRLILDTFRSEEIITLYALKYGQILGIFMIIYGISMIFLKKR